MARKSSMAILPQDIRAQLHALLNDPRMTQLGITARINELLADGGHDDRVSKSSVNRYAVQMEKVGAKLKQSRQIAEVWIGKLGSEPQGQVGQLLNEVVRNLAFDTAMHLSEEEEPADPRLIKELAIAIERLEKAASDNEKRADEIRRKQREEDAGKLKALEDDARKGRGKFDPEALRRVREEVYGIV